MIIARYISKEILSTFCAIIFILLFIALSNKFVMLLAKAAAGKLPASLVFKIVGLYIPELFAVLAPVAMFIAILFTHSRLHADSEIAVLLTSGFDWARLTRITLVVAGGIAVLVTIMNLYIVPAISIQRERILADGKISAVLNAIVPGRFKTIEDHDQLVFYVENILPNGELHNIFIAQQPSPESGDADKDMVVITAKKANIQPQENPNEFYLVLQDGHRYVGTPGNADYKVTSFDEYGRQIKYAAAEIPRKDFMRSTKELMDSDDPTDNAEFQWRIAMPIAVLLLALIAIPLAKVQPRQGRYAKFLPAVLIFMVYYNMMIIARRSIARGNLPEFPGLWALHMLFLLCAIVFLLHVSGRLAEYTQKWFKS